MPGTRFRIEQPSNEPQLAYLPGSMERQELKSKLAELGSSVLNIPAIIGGRDVLTGKTRDIVMPHKQKHVIGRYHEASENEVQAAIDSALEARKTWSVTPWYDRAAVFLKAADLLAGPWRQTLNAAAMLSLSKNVFQAEIDSGNELTDFLRFNVFYMQDIYEMQVSSGPREWNRIEYRPLEGFVFAVTPFNFISIMGNLPTAPAMMGNVVVWKPASSAVYPSYLIMRLLMEAGLPDGVINFVPGPGHEVGRVVLGHRDLAGIHFTGSTSTFQNMWRTVGENIQAYRTYPRIVGETGGKGFVFAHKTADVHHLVTALIRGAFEYSGQKCSAASRAYIPESMWPVLKATLIDELEQVKMGDPEDFSTLVNAVIDESAFQKIVLYIEHARHTEEMQVVAGGRYDNSEGFFVEPTVVQTSNPHSLLMEEEIFGPVLTVYVYPDDEYERALTLCDGTSPYGLTGSIFARDRDAIVKATDILRDAAGNFYINDKPTGAVVGRQPFGGARSSGTNDKAGSRLNLLRWVSPRTIKENFVPPEHFSYPYMSKE